MDFTGIYTCKLDGVDYGCSAVVRCGGALIVGCTAALLLVGVSVSAVRCGEH